jgi:superfamily II DNA/RNA helicase
VYDIESTPRIEALRALLDRRGEDSVIVFGRTKHGVKKLAQRLDAMGYPTAALHGNLSQNARERVMASFRSGAVPILLATNVAARGLDVPEVAQVINFELPESPEWFTHRVGRTGRMGRSGRAITLLAPEDATRWRQFEKVLGRHLERRSWAHPTRPITVAASTPVAPSPTREPAMPARRREAQPFAAASRRQEPPSRRPRPRRRRPAA